MSFYRGPKIVTNGLVLALDAADKNSYPGTGTSWNDLSGNGNNGILVNGVGYSQDNLGTLVFDGTNDYVSTNSTVGNFGTSNFTISLVFKTTTTTSPATFIAKSIGDSPTTDYGWLLNQSSSGEIGFAVATVNGSWGTAGSYSIKTSGANINNGLWKHVAIVANRSQADVTIYVNGISTSLATYVGRASLTTLGNITNTRILNIGSESDVASVPWPVAASISIVQLYNRALTQTEVLQNFNALRGRFAV